VNRGSAFGSDGEGRNRNGRSGSEQLASPLKAGAAGRAKDAVVADFGNAFGQDVLKKAVDKLGCRKRDVADLLSFVIAVAEADEAAVERLQPTVGDGDAKHVAAEILEDFIAPARMLGVNDPAQFPDGRRNEAEESRLSQPVAKFGAEEDRQSTDGNEELGMFGIDPGLAIGRQASGGDEQVDVRMERWRASRYEERRERQAVRRPMKDRRRESEEPRRRLSSAARRAVWGGTVRADATGREE
jgi:hypothetical protein